MGQVGGPSLMRPSGRQTGRVFCEGTVPVSARPAVELFVARTPGPAGNPLLVIHGGPDWDHTYLREPLGQLAGRRRVILPDLRGCGRSTPGPPRWPVPPRRGRRRPRRPAVRAAHRAGRRPGLLLRRPDRPAAGPG